VPPTTVSRPARRVIRQHRPCVGFGRRCGRCCAVGGTRPLWFTSPGGDAQASLAPSGPQPHDTTFRGYRGGFPARHAACASAFGERRISTGPTQQPNRARAEPRSFAREFGDARQRGGRRPTLNDNSSRESPLRSKRNAYRSSSRNIFGADGVRRDLPSWP
jgi:hypothetical protein